MGRIDDFIGQTEQARDDARYEIEDAKMRISVYRVEQRGSRPGIDNEVNDRVYSHSLYATIVKNRGENETYAGITLDDDVRQGDSWYILNREFGMLRLQVTSVSFNNSYYDVELTK